MNKRRKWKKYDINLLKITYTENSNKTLGYCFDRTPAAIRNKASELGLLKKLKAAKVEPEPEPIVQTATGEYKQPEQFEKTASEFITIIKKLINLFKISK